MKYLYLSVLVLGLIPMAFADDTIDNPFCEAPLYLDCGDADDTGSLTYADTHTEGSNYFLVSGIPNSYTAGESFVIEVLAGTFYDDASVGIWGIDDSGIATSNATYANYIDFGFSTHYVEFTPKGTMTLTVGVGSSDGDVLAHYIIPEG